MHILQVPVVKPESQQSANREYGVKCENEMQALNIPYIYIGGNFWWCKFSYKLPIKIFVFLIFVQLSTAQHKHSDVEHIDIIVQGNFHKF